jgi:hypothetical protein
MSLKAKENLLNEAASPLPNKNTTWITIYASTAANQDIKP